MSYSQLSATCSFALVVFAALGTAIFHFSRGPSLFFRGGSRLALAAYLLCAAIWALDSFIGTFIGINSPSACQAAVAFASFFDQAARVILVEFIFWSMKPGLTATFGVVFPQAFILVRLVVGLVFVGNQRPEFTPVCLPVPLLWPIGMGLLSMDAFIMILLLARASTVGVFKDMKAIGPESSRAKAIIFLTMALCFWTPASIAMILGITNAGIATQTALPAVGVLFVIACIALCYRVLGTPLEESGKRVEAYDDKYYGASETGKQYLPNVRPASPFRAFPRPRQGTGGTADTQAGASLPSLERMNTLPIISRPSPGQAAAGIGGLPVVGELFPPMRSESISMKQNDMQRQPTKKAVLKGGKMVISYPIVPGSDQGGKNKGQVIGRKPVAKPGLGQSQKSAAALRDPGSPDSEPPVPPMKELKVFTDPSEYDSMLKRPRPIPRKRKMMEDTVAESVVSLVLPRTPQDAASAPPHKALKTKPSIRDNSAPGGSPSKKRGVPRLPTEPAKSTRPPRPTDDVTMPLSDAEGEGSGHGGVAAENEALAEASAPPPRADKPKPAQTNASARAAPRKQDIKQEPKQEPKQEIKQEIKQEPKHDPKTPAWAKRHEDAAAGFASKFSIATTASSFEVPATGQMPSSAMALLRSSQDGQRQGPSTTHAVKGAQEPAAPALAPTRPGQPLAELKNPVSVRRVQELKDAATAAARKAVAAATAAAAAAAVPNAPPVPTHISVGSSLAESAFLDDGKEMMTVMLDRSTDHPLVGAAAHAPIPSDRINDDGMTGRSGSWHRRVGDNCPSFSERDVRQNRRSPKPPPLELGRVTKRPKEVPVQISPLETPQHALDMIQEQLKKLEEPDTDVTDSDKQQQQQQQQQQPSPSPSPLPMPKMHVDLSRASFSTHASNPNALAMVNGPNSSKSILMMQLLDSINKGIIVTDSQPLPPLPSKDDGRPRSSLLFAADQVPVGHQAAIADESPENSESSDESLIYTTDRNDDDDNGPLAMPTAGFGNEVVRGTDTWQAQGQKKGVSSAAAKQDGAQPQAKSPSHWGGLLSPESASASASAAAMASQAPPPDRPRTLKPPRKSRAISTLPDIVENPEPLAHDEAALGIFQFPGGEKSDKAAFPRMMPGAVPVFPNAHAQMQLQVQMQMQQSHERPSSFFDYYFDNDDGDDMHNLDEAPAQPANDADAFDEATLWDIAALLKTDKVPSRESLFPRQKQRRQKPRSSGPGAHLQA